MHVYYLNKHLMCEHYRNNSPTGFRVLKEQKGVTTHTDPSRTAMIFLLEGCMHVEGKSFQVSPYKPTKCFRCLRASTTL